MPDVDSPKYKILPDDKRYENSKVGLLNIKFDLISKRD